MKSLAAVVLDSVELAFRVNGNADSDGLGARVEHDLAVARGFVPELNQLCIGVVAPCLQYVLAAGRDIGRVVVPVLWAVAELISAHQLVGPILSQPIECGISANRAQAVCLAVGVGVVDDVLYAVGGRSNRLCSGSRSRRQVDGWYRKVRATEVAEGAGRLCRGYTNTEGDGCCQCRGDELLGGEVNFGGKHERYLSTGT